MRNALSNTLKAAVIVALPALALAATPARPAAARQAAQPHPAISAAKPAPAPAAKADSHAAKPAAKSPSKMAVGTHTAAGVVKSVTDSNLVIESPRHGKARSMSFEMKPGTEREGKLEVGSRVSVRYRNEGSEHVATAVMARAAKRKS